MDGPAKHREAVSQPEPLLYYCSHDDEGPLRSNPGQTAHMVVEVGGLAVLRCHVCTD